MMSSLELSAIVCKTRSQSPPLEAWRRCQRESVTRPVTALAVAPSRLARLRRMPPSRRSAKESGFNNGRITCSLRADPGLGGMLGPLSKMCFREHAELDAPCPWGTWAHEI